MHVPRSVIHVPESVIHVTRSVIHVPKSVIRVPGLSFRLPERGIHTHGSVIHTPPERKTDSRVCTTEAPRNATCTRERNSSVRVRGSNPEAQGLRPPNARTGLR